MTCILLDIDDVLHVSGEPSPGAVEAVTRLRSDGHTLRFVTNNSTRPRDTLAEELPRKTRSMLTMAILVALGKPNELRVHVKGAIANGVTEDEIREVLMHTAVYCGIPAGVEGFRNARQALDELEAA